jgi:DNA-binding PadR family transcriptional regulator
VTSAELAVLSLVAETPRHGYDIERLIVQRGMREWTDIGFSSIYYLLGKMEKAGLVESEVVEAHAGESGQRGPARKVYSLTPAGRVAWREASLRALSVPESRSPFALGLSNLPSLSSEQASTALREYRTQLLERLAGVEAKRAAQQPLEWFVTELFDFSETMLRAEVEWIDGLIGRMDDRTKGESHAQAQGE